MHFAKYHGLGNDYIVIEPGEFDGEPATGQIVRICHRNYGVGSDGILYGPLSAKDADFGLRIFNPDGSEAEKSGNGLRIFSRYLWDKGMVQEEPFTISTIGGLVRSRVFDGGKQVTVEMGKVSFNSRVIPIVGPEREVINENISIAGGQLTFCAATIGNPHCVVICDTISEEETRRLGPLIENDVRFPNRTNVQFLQIIDRENIRIEIWERGAGYTLASGSSSCAAAAVAHKLGLCGSRITVHMPGGQMEVSVAEDFSIKMTGPVINVCSGEVSDEAFLH
ncbi:MAG: diaminopimelate epimerase [Armatimonadota bacterium]|nr:diaminopimelate epimerase [Armatimonadota bacterium]